MPASPLIKKARNIIELKKELVAKYEIGVHVAELARMYGKSTSMISFILAKKKEIKEADVAKGVNVLTKQRSQSIKDLEKLLVWINEQQLAGDSVSEAIICEKARLLHADLAKKMPGMSAAVSEFKPAEAVLTNSRSELVVYTVW